MGTLVQDLRFGVRGLLRHPGFSAVAVATLALGIGATAAVFSVVNGVLLRPLPYPEPERLVLVWESNPERGWKRFSTSPANFRDWREQDRAFEQLGAYSFVNSGYYLRGDRPERVRSAEVTVEVFQALAAEPVVGRLFEAGEDQEGAERVVLLSFGLWQRRFGGDRGIVGRTIELDGLDHTVVGVMPAAVRFPNDPDLWVPLVFRPEHLENRIVRWVRGIGRLREGVTLAQAGAGMAAIAHRLEVDYPEANEGFGVILDTLHEYLVGDVRPALLVLLGAVGFVLAIACANVANLMLNRAAARQREFALRSALGARSWRLARQLLTESLLLGLLGGGLGLLLAQLGVRLLLIAAPSHLPRLDAIAVDGRVLGVTLLLAITTGLAFGLAPVLQVRRLAVSGVLKEGGRGSTAGGSQASLRSLLVVSEVSLALVLLVGAGLMIRSFSAMTEVDPGFYPDRVLTLQIGLPETRYATAPERVTLLRQLLERVDALPGVTAVGAVNALPLSGTEFKWDFLIEGRPPHSLKELPAAEYRIVSPDYFRAMGLTLLDGRYFENRDDRDAPRVAIVNQAMASRFWPGEKVLGRRITIGTVAGSFDRDLPISAQIVGVVGDVRHFGLTQAARPEMYVPFPVNPAPFDFLFLAIRTEGGEQHTTLPAAVENEIRGLDRDLAIYDVRTVEQRLRASVSQARSNMAFLGAFAAIALLLASVGIYGVVSYAVGQRTHEIGIRLSLGARPRDILRMVLGQGARLAAVGLAVGLALVIVLTLVLTRLWSGLFFEVDAADPATILMVLPLLAAVVLVASLVPARRAARVDPTVALRQE